MRLAVFTSTYPARVATFFERDMRALIDSGIDVEIFAISPLDPRLWRYGLELLSAEVLPRDRVHHLGIADCIRRARPWPPRRLARLARDAALVSASAVRHGLIPLAKSGYVVPKAWVWAHEFADRYDHVLAYWGNYAGTCAYLFHRLAGRPIPFSIWLHAGTDLYRTPVFLREKMRYADTIITCCEFNRRYMRERFQDIGDEIRDKIHVCYHGLDLAQFPYRPEARPPHTVVAVGRLAERKGFDYLLRAVRLLVDRQVAVDLELVGDGDQLDALKALAQSLGIGERVRFRGWMKFEDARRAMSEATMLVHPSDGLGDGLPNVLREAMALGTPVIASGVAGIPEALDNGRCGMMVPPRDVTALADAIQAMLRDGELRRGFAERARRRTEDLFDLRRNGAGLASHLRGTTRPAPRLRPRLGAETLPVRS
jgi:glycosyltransferase involved in cell wall biosynthesis